MSTWEQIRVKHRECRAKFGRGEGTTLTAGKALRFVDNMTFSETGGNECDDPEVMIWENECGSDVRDQVGRTSEIVFGAELSAVFKSKAYISALEIESRVWERGSQCSWKALPSPLPRPSVGMMSTRSDTTSFSPILLKLMRRAAREGKARIRRSVRWVQGVRGE